ncbi:MAG: amino acid racemase [Phycisphaeraceae bacterium]|nr:MAG: amino acid racemase [Phycisphaeraceae bacterium]
MAAKHIGVVGASPEGAAIFIRQLARHASRLLPPDQHPVVTLHCERLDDYLQAIHRDDWHAVARLMQRSAGILASCGAQFVVSPEQIVLHAMQLAEAGSPVPWLTSPELLARVIAGRGHTKVGVVGTKMVTRAGAYQTHLGLKGVHVLVPDDDDCETLERVIFGELLYGSCRAESASAVLSVIARLGERGCEGVILGSSEVPMIVSSLNSPLPVYDAADILAEGAIQRSMG